MQDNNPITPLVVGFRGSVLVFTAAHLGVFEFIGKKTVTLGRICSGLGLDPWATRVFLDGLVSLGFLVKKGFSYKNSRIAISYLVPNSEYSVSNNIKCQYRLLKAWMDLPSILFSGRPSQELSDRLKSKLFRFDYLKGMEELARLTAPQVESNLSQINGNSVLDVGGGHGLILKEFLDKRKFWSGAILDLAPVIGLAKKSLKEHVDRVEFIAGDYRKMEFGKSKYDLVIMSQIVHDEPQKTVKRLLENAWRALKPDGCLAVHDFLVDSDRTRPRFSTLLSVHLLTYTRAGRIYSLSEFRRFFKAAGFTFPKCLPINKGRVNQSFLMIANKKWGTG